MQRMVARWQEALIVILIPILAMAVLGQLGFDGFGQPWDWLTLIVVWIIGLGLILRKPLPYRGNRRMG